METAHERGWSRLQNGALLEAAEAAGFDIFITTDANLRYQQRLTGRRLSIVVPLSTSWPRIRQAADSVFKAIDEATQGSYQEVDIPGLA